MKIYKTQITGFCFGAKRAVEALENAIETVGKRDIFTYGKLVHNEEVNRHFAEKGVKVADSIDDITPNSVVLIRSHGISQKEFALIKEKNAEMIDMTCPKVKKIHKIAQNADFLLIIGDKNHPEVKGIVGNCRDRSLVIKNQDEFLSFLENGYDPKINYTLVAQTTYLLSEWLKIEQTAKNYSNIKIMSTICDSTEKRQNQVAELSKNVDLFIIIGGKDSSNTRKLFETASENCETIHLENTKSLPQGLNKYQKIGLSSGASTPDSAVEEVIKIMMNENDNIEMMEGADEFLEAVNSIKTIRNGQKVKGIVTSINGTEVQVDLGVKHAGFIPYSEFEDDEEPLKVNDEIEAFVVKVNDAEGTAQLSKKNLDMAQGLEKILKACENKDIVSGKVVDVIKGGLIVLVNKIRVFVPASQASLKREEDLEPYKNQNVQLRIIEAEAERSKRRKIIGSIRSVLREEKAKANEEIWASLAVGNSYEGTVKSLTDFGAFVDIGGVDGLVHVTDIAWTRIKNPAEVLAVGDKVSVTVKALNPEKKRISLTMKKDEENPWKILQEQYNVGDVIDSTILKIAPYGAFATVIKGIDGLIHISQIAPQRIAKVSDVLSEGAQVKAKIIEIDTENKKVSLSIKAVDEDNAVAEETVSEENPSEE